MEIARQMGGQPRYRKATLIALSEYASDDAEALAQVSPVQPARKGMVK